MSQAPTDGAGSSKKATGNGKPATKKSSVPPAPSAPRQLGSIRATSESSSSGPASSSPAPRAIGNQAKINDSASSSTGTGLAFTPSSASARPAPKKLSFKAKVVARSETPATPAPVAESSNAAASSSTRGRGRGGADRGRGRGRGGGFTAPEATASGPFALGPGEQRGSVRRAPIRFASTPGAGGSSIFGIPSAGPPPPRSNLGGVGIGFKEEEKEDLSDADEPGLKRIELSAVRDLDYMAPEALRKVVEVKRKKTKTEPSVKPEPQEDATMAEATRRSTPEDAPDAVDLSDDEMPDELRPSIAGDFHQGSDGQAELSQDGRLFFFQFPSPFPTFLPRKAPKPEVIDVDMDAQLAADSSTTTGSDGTPIKPGSPTLKRAKSVSFAPETKPPMPVIDAPENKTLDGVIGELEFYASGAVKMRLGNGILLEISEGTQPSFLQHAVYVGKANAEDEKKSMVVLGEISKRYVVSPDVDALLDEMDHADVRDRLASLNSATPMDVD